MTLIRTLLAVSLGLALALGASSSALAGASPNNIFVGDFNGDTRSDILLVNGDDSLLALWFMNGTTIDVVTSGSTPTLYSGAEVVATGHFGTKDCSTGAITSDSKSDLVVQNSSTGAITIAYMNGLVPTCDQPVVTALANWDVQGTGDFNKDSWDDLVLQNATTGEFAVWIMTSSGTVDWANSASYPSPGSANLNIEVIADLDGDNKADLLLRDRDDGTMWRYLFDGSAATSTLPFATLAVASWTVVGAANIDNANGADLIFQQTGGLGLVYWTLGSDGKTITGNTVMPSMLAGFNAVQIGDLGGTGTSCTACEADLIMEGGGRIGAWYLDENAGYDGGGTFAEGLANGAGDPTTWAIVGWADGQP